MTLWRVVLASLFLGALVASRAAEPDFEFSGILTADGATRVALTDKRSDTTQWIEVGGEFNGYQISRYDATEDTLTVARNGQDFRLRLVSPKTAVSGAVRAMSGGGAPSTEAAANAIRGNLRTLAIAARQHLADRGATTVTYSELVGPGKVIADLKPIAGENYQSLTFTPNTHALSIKMGDGTLVSVDLPPAPPTAPALAQAPTIPAVVAPSPTPLPPEPPLTPTGRTPPASGSYLTQSGDTWDRISASTGVPMDELRRLNPSLTGGSLPAGQTIRIR